MNKEPDYDEEEFDLDEWMENLERELYEDDEPKELDFND